MLKNQLFEDDGNNPSIELILDIVSGPTNPVGMIAALFWNSMTASLVRFPNMPLAPALAKARAARPTLFEIKNCCKKITSFPIEPTVRFREKEDTPPDKTFPCSGAAGA